MSVAGAQRNTGLARAVAVPCAGASRANGPGGTPSGPMPPAATVRAPSRSARRPEAVLPCRAGMPRPPQMTADRSWEGENPGWTPRTTAAMPDTCGAAIEVPDM